MTTEDALLCLRPADSIDEARSVKLLLALKDDSGNAIYTIRTLADKVGRKRSWIQRRSLLSDANDIICDLIRNGDVTAEEVESIMRARRAKIRGVCGKKEKARAAGAEWWGSITGCWITKTDFRYANICLDDVVRSDFLRNGVEPTSWRSLVGSQPSICAFDVERLDFVELMNFSAALAAAVAVEGNGELFNREILRKYSL